MAKNMLNLQADGKQVTTLSDAALLLATINPAALPDDAVISWGDLKTLLKDTLPMRDMLMSAYPRVTKDWSDTAGFTAAHTGTGAFTPNLYAGVATTGATISSRFCLHSGSVFPLAQVANLYERLRMRINPTTVMNSSILWLGFTTNPTAPTSTEHHAAFKIVNGLIYASCGNGTNGNLVSTGLSTGQYALTDLYIKERAGAIEYYVEDTLTNTFTTYLPNSYGLALTFNAVNTAAAAITFNLFPFCAMQGA